MKDVLAKLPTAQEAKSKGFGKFNNNFNDTWFSEYMFFHKNPYLIGFENEHINLPFFVGVVGLLEFAEDYPNPDYTYAPSLSQLQTWLRVVHGCNVYPTQDSSSYWNVDIKVFTNLVIHLIIMSMIISICTYILITIFIIILNVYQNWI